MYYAVFLFQQAGISATRGSLLANGIQGVVLNVFTWPNMYWMDTWGRRNPMVIGGVGMGISMMLIGTIMKTKGRFLFLFLFLDSTDGGLHDTREPDLQSHDSEDQLRFQQPLCVLCHNCFRVCLCHDFCSDLGLCRVGIPSGAIHHGLSWTWHVHDFSDELVCGMFKYLTIEMNGIDSLELLVCPVHSNGDEPNFVSLGTHQLEILWYSDVDSWKLYMVFMTLCFTMAIVVFLFYPVRAKMVYS